MSQMKKYKIYLVPHFHYDAAYDKTYEEYLEIAFADLIEMFNIMDKYPEYRFLIEQVIMLREFWNAFPEYREKLKQLITEGMIEIGPGMFVMPDMNLISGESLIRQNETGRRWLKEKLGAVPATCWIADCWGHHGQLPQILKKCGYKYYAFSRAMRSDLTDKSEFVWQGIDGTTILTHWMPNGYNAIVFRGFTYLPSSEEDTLRGIRGLSADEFDLKRLSEVIQKLSEFSSGNVILLPNGSDFTRPQANLPLLIKKWNKDNSNIKIKFSLPIEIFNIWEKESDNIPTVLADFNPLFQGTYCSRIYIKQANRYMENHIDTAEKLLACIPVKGERFSYKVEDATELMLYNQFHDIICGSLIDEAYEDALSKYERAKGYIKEVIDSSLDKFMEMRPEGGSKLGLLVFNPLVWERKDIVFGRINFSQDGVKGLKIKDINGKDVSAQILEMKEVLRKDEPHYTQFHFIFPVETPALGYTSYSIQLCQKENKTYPTSLMVKNKIIENLFYRLKISDMGIIKSLIHKASGEEFVDSERPYFNDLIFQIDQGDFWEYYETPPDENVRATRTYQDPYPLGEQNRNRKAVFSHQSPQVIEIVEKGPIRLSIKVKGKVSLGASSWEYIQYIYLYDNIRRIDFLTEFIPYGKEYRVRVAFPTSIKNGNIRYEIPFGIQERPEGEYPALNWIDYQDTQKGICLVNRGLPGNNVTDGVMMLSLFRAVDMGPGKEKCETGHGEGIKHAFEYSIIPFLTKEKPYHPWQYGYEFNQPVITRISRFRKDIEPEKSFISVSPANVVLSSVRMVKDGILLRIYEAEGKRTEFELVPSDRFSKVYETDCLGENPVKSKFTKKCIRGKINPFEIKTFIIRDGLPRAKNV